MVINIKVLDVQTLDFIKLCTQYQILVSFRTCDSETNFYEITGSLRNFLMLFFECGSRNIFIWQL